MLSPINNVIELKDPDQKKSELKVFKGRQAKLNGLVINMLLIKEALAIYDIFRFVNKVKGFKKTKYCVIYLRIRMLEQQGYLKKAGYRPTKQGKQTAMFKVTARGKLALILKNKSLNELVDLLDENSTKELIKVLTIEKNHEVQ